MLVCPFKISIYILCFFSWRYQDKKKRNGLVLATTLFTLSKEKRRGVKMEDVRFRFCPPIQTLLTYFTRHKDPRKTHMCTIFSSLPRHTCHIFWARLFGLRSSVHVLNSLGIQFFLEVADKRKWGNGKRLEHFFLEEHTTWKIWKQGMSRCCCCCCWAVVFMYFFLHLRSKRRMETKL